MAGQAGPVPSTLCLSIFLFVCLYGDRCFTVAVSITQSPVETSVNRGSSVTLTCTATGVSTPSILWYKQHNNGTLQLISGTGAYSISTVTSNVNRTSQLTITNVAVSYSGNYLCRAYNLDKNATSDTAYLTVIGEW